MTKTEIAAINRAIALLNSLTGEPYESVPLPRSCAVTRFVREYLAPDPVADISCAEAWGFFCEVAQAGELPPVRKAIFLRQLPGAMEAVYDVRKCHNIERAGGRVRGFKGITLNEQA